MKTTRLRISLAAITITASFAIASQASAQGLSDIGAGQVPYVLFLLDTSGSTEWTDAGDERYPVRDPADYGGIDPLFDASDPNPVEWQADLEMEVWDESKDSSYGSNVDDGPIAFGPCFVWEPEDCDDYRRPSWFAGTGADSTWYPSDTSTEMVDRYDIMLGDDSTPTAGVRLYQNSQPRHVTLKEVLAGQMVLKPKNSTKTRDTLNPSTEGPGCWFVRRQIGASVLDSDEQDYCASDFGNFSELPDHEEPRPHFQEVHTYTKPNSGILENYRNQAVFGVAFMDGFADDVSGWPDRLNDDISNSTIPTNSWRNSTNNEGTGGNVNLGVYKIVTPNEIEIDSGFLEQMSRFIQVAVNDAGAIGDSDYRNTVLEADKDKFAWLGLNFDKDAKNLIDPYRMGDIPVARATPIAAAIADIHQFMITEERFQDETDGGSDREDNFARCRSKHVVILTDGYPEPERAGSVASTIGQSGLTPAFGYGNPPDEYRYEHAEAEIEQFVANTAIPPADPADRNAYGPRVWVVSLDVQNDPSLRTEIAAKLSAMALAGNTCASHIMPGKVQSGGCDPAVEWCLVDQPSGSWDPPDGTGSTTCEDPAVMITDNSPASVEAALDAVMGGIVGNAGTTSRTRAAVTNYLDDNTKNQGGQYRIFSATDTGGGSYWRGVLSRQFLSCAASGDLSAGDGAGVDTALTETIGLHNQIADQVDCTTPPCTDSRRIFTSVPAGEIYDYENSRYRTLSSALPSTQDIFHWRFMLAKSAGNDEFGTATAPTTLPAPVNHAGYIFGTRIPFIDSLLSPGFDDANTGFYTGWGSTPYYNYWGTDPANTSEFELVVDVYRGRVPEKATGNDDTERVLGAIVNSDPTPVGPPDLDLPIESYRAFRARYGDRPTMLYFSTTEGLLHSVYTGFNQGRVNIRAKSTTKGADNKDDTKGAEAQREAWAYMPAMLHRKLSSTVYSQPYLMDGEPTVKDVRLCLQDADENQNQRACGALRDGSGETLTGEQQWRTVLVQGLGRAGQGYLAMDITRVGGIELGASDRKIQNPDPIPLWEFDRTWEEQQIEYMVANSLGDRVLPAPTVTTSATDDDAQTWVDTDNDDVGDTACSTADPVWENALLGTSISRPAIATVQIRFDKSGNPVTRQRPIAVFGGGQSFDQGEECGVSVTGSAIYVVDLQTGSLLRRFVDYDDGSALNTFHRADFGGGDIRDVEFTGSPALFDSFTGSVATRGFIGGSEGRLYKIDFSNPNPANWGVSLFYDPYQNTTLMGLAVDSSGTAIPLGPAGFKPAIARSPDKDLVIAYGLGEPGEATQPGRAQAAITLLENDAGGSELLWYEVFPEGEKMTGDPLIFNQVTYFPTYQVPDADLCEPGTAKIWALEYFKDPSAVNKEAVGAWNTSDPQFLSNPDINIDATNGKWFGPATPTLIRGLTLTTGPACTVRGLGTNSQDTDGLEGADPQPQLIAQTSGVPAGGLEDANAGANDAVSRIVVDLERPRSMTVPLSWSVIGN